MPRRLGLGPVFRYEWLLASRRWQLYAARSLTVLPLSLALAVFWTSWDEATIPRQAEMAEVFYQWTAMILLGLVGLAAPAATAGAVCQDKVRGNLALLFASDLSDVEIVLGKLAARLVPVVGMILVAAPVMAFAMLFGGIDPVGMLGALLVVLACAVFGCSLAMLLSVWGTKTHEVLIVTYALGILYVLAAPLVAVLQTLVPVLWRWFWMPSFMDLLWYNPVFLVVAQGNSPPGMPRVTIAAQGQFLALGVAASVVMVAVATWRVRRVVVHQMSRGERPSSRRRWRLGPGPSLDRNPVLWRECHRAGPSPWSRFVWGSYVVIGGGVSLYAVVLIVQGDTGGRALGLMANVAMVGAGLLLLSASAATSLAEERQRGSLDVLMASPLSTGEIVWGKWWGAFRGVPPLAVLPCVVTTALAWKTGNLAAVPLTAIFILACGASITSLGLAMATWIARMGRAAAVTVGAYVVLSLGWIPLAMVFFGGAPGYPGPGVASASPVMGVGMLGSFLDHNSSRHEAAEAMIWVAFWTFAHAGAALSLLLATLGTFNLCLGRVDDRIKGSEDSEEELPDDDDE